MTNKWERRKTTNQESEPKTYTYTGTDMAMTPPPPEITVEANDEELIPHFKPGFVLEKEPTPQAKAPTSGNPRRTFSSIAAQAKQEAKQPKEYTEPMEFEGPVDFIKKLIVHRKHVTSELKSRVKTLATSLELQALQAIEQAVKQRKVKLK